MLSGRKKLNDVVEKQPNWNANDKSPWRRNWKFCVRKSKSYSSISVKWPYNVFSSKSRR